ncbi:hypothetical protein KGF54_000136 [Candida jiufengensis]|uniref:uncharacterized protein n=1 Tax=Candida jiufengensis TaxID=497108 RepID=UPI0022255FEA|nr:uncharacterized protein KGF54_000136 [Candida jiufengensis]KAI5957208.1 hypothetical protein KGF54_000136 [Candida jiufengensis]
MNGYNINNGYPLNDNNSPSIPQINIANSNNNNNNSNYTHNNQNNNSRLNFNSIKHLYTDQNKLVHSDNNSYENLSPPYRRPSMSVDSIPYDDSPQDDSSIPLSLTAQELTLQESKTYMRWYSDILARTNNRTISINDVFNFLINFKITDDCRNQINQIFNKISYSVNIGEFFALLRVISHTLKGETPSRKLIKVVAPVPTPPSILSKKRLNDEEEDTTEEQTPNTLDDNKPMAPLDIDSFTQFLLTGERPDSNSNVTTSKIRKSKKVKFSDQINIHDSSQNYISPIHSPLPTLENQLDYSLPMDQLLIQMANKQPQKEQEEEKEELKDMESQINHFHNLNTVDTISVDGTPRQPQSLENDNDNNNNNDNQLLKPNMTGPAQMSKFISSLNSEQPSYQNDNLTPLRPNVTGPADMARLFAPNQQQQQNHQQSPPHQQQNQNQQYNLQQSSSQQQQQQQQEQQTSPKISLSAFSSQMTGQTMENTLQNGKPPVPRHRSYSSPTPNKNAPPPPPPRRRNISNTNQRSISPLPQQQQNSPSPLRYNAYNNQQQFSPQPPALPPKIPNDVYSGNNDSTTNILDDLKALQEEVDKIRNLTGGF